MQAAKVRYSRKLKITNNECTVKKFRNLYVEALKERRRIGDDGDVTELCLKKEDVPCFWEIVRMIW